MRLRLATISDAGSCVAIYAPYVLRTNITFEETVPESDDFAKRIDKVLGRHVWIVAETESKDSSGKPSVAGYAYASTFRERLAYRWVCESSIYLAESGRGKGLGTRLYRALLDILTLQGYQRVYGVLTLPNPASESLHERFGFTLASRLPRSGWKLGAWHDVGIYDLTLQSESDGLPPEVKTLDRLDPASVNRILTGLEGR